MSALAATGVNGAHSDTNAIAWIFDGRHWSGSGGIPARLGQYLEISGVSMGIALLLAIPVAAWLGHLGRGGFLATSVSNVGRAIPSFALLVLAVQFVGIGNTSAEIALVALGVPPMVTNTYVGISNVDDDVKDAARGMGMSGWQVFLMVELPLALPLILAGVRTSTVNVVATATLAAEVGSGGLGRYIVDGEGLQDFPQLLAGAILVALLAVVLEGLLALLQRRVTPPSAARS